MGRRGVSVRSVRRGAVASALVGLAVPLLPSGAGAVQAEETWSRSTGVSYSSTTLPDGRSSVEALYFNLNGDAPFHSFVKATLVDCNGTVVRTTYGRTVTTKRDGGRWTTHAQASLNVPRTGGPYSHWSVAVAVKGHPTTRHRVVEVPGETSFRLGCAPGEYRRPATMTWNRHDREVVERPVNAKFSVPVSTLVRTSFRFGKPKGSVRAGTTLTVGATGVMVKRKGSTKRVLTSKRAGCQHNLEFTAPKDVSDSRGVDLEPCWTRRIPVPRKASGRATAGSRLLVHSTVWKDQHQYVRIRDLGVVKKARTR